MVKSNQKKMEFAEKIAEAESVILERSKRIDFYMTDYSIELLVEKMEKEDFVIPTYQREYTWDEPRKSKFIESVIMGLPIPFLFFWERPDGRLEIVDGSQRLRTLQEYIKHDLKLNKLDDMDILNSTDFNDLPSSRQRKILNKPIRGIVLNERADPQARFDIFERINTSSKLPNPAEVRRGALAGPFQSLVEELAQLTLFSTLAPTTEIQKKERIPEELVTRFFAYGDGLEDYKDEPKRFIFNYTKKMNDVFKNQDELSEVYNERFVNMLNFVNKTFANGFKKVKNANTTPRVRFEAIAIGVDQAITERPSLLAQDPAPTIDSWIESTEFKAVTTSGSANVKSKLQNRILFVRDALLEK